ncbi:MAG TPA: hypothetical protein VFN21_01665, partial [Acidimicrobiales bacterium]|nr:hypothetical protein [Acidimicrobiales bacterium]
MHPIEYLRYVARAGDAPPDWLIPEAAEALRGLIGDHQALVMGCRKLLEHHARCGPMWWLCGQVLTSRDPHRVLDDLVERFLADPTPLQLSLALVDATPGTADSPLIVEAALASAAGVVARDGTFGGSPPPGAESAGREIWVVAGIGTLVPVEIFAAATGDGPGGADDDETGRAASPGSFATGLRGAVDVMAIDTIDRVIRPTASGGVELLRTGPD